MISDAERARLNQQFDALVAEEQQIVLQRQYDYQNIAYLSEQIGYINMNLMRFDLTNDQRLWYENQKRILNDQLNYYNTKVHHSAQRLNQIFFEKMSLCFRLT